MDIFQYQYLTIALVGALLSAVSTALLSVFVSLRKIAYMSDALAHVAFAGIAIAFLTGGSLTLSSVLLVSGVALLIGFLSRRHRLDQANGTSIFLAVAMALAIILIRLRKQYTFDLASYLFGNVLLIEGPDLISLGVLLGVNLLFLLAFYKELFYLTYNEEMAACYGVPAGLLNSLFLVVLAVNIVLTVKVTGIVLVTAQLILPGITALNLVRRVKGAIVVAVLLSLLGSGGGFVISYALDIPSGATIVLLLFLLFLLSLLLKRERRVARS